MGVDLCPTGYDQYSYGLLTTIVTAYQPRDFGQVAAGTSASALSGQGPFSLMEQAAHPLPSLYPHPLAPAYLGEGMGGIGRGKGMGVHPIPLPQPIPPPPSPISLLAYSPANPTRQPIADP